MARYLGNAAFLLVFAEQFDSSIREKVSFIANLNYRVII